MTTPIKPGRYMMATTAIHLLGDISRDTPDLCIVHEETETDYIGNWVCGFGFVNVRFPKTNTRPLTEEEHERYHGTKVGIEGSWHYQLNTRE